VIFIVVTRTHKWRTPKKRIGIINNDHFR
jgi:hypothetical protein